MQLPPVKGEGNGQPALPGTHGAPGAARGAGAGEDLVAGEQDWMGEHGRADATFWLLLKFEHKTALKLSSFCQHLEDDLLWDLSDGHADMPG